MISPQKPSGTSSCATTRWQAIPGLSSGTANQGFLGNFATMDEAKQAGIGNSRSDFGVGRAAELLQSDSRYRDVVAHGVGRSGAVVARRTKAGGPRKEESGDCGPDRGVRTLIVRLLVVKSAGTKRGREPSGHDSACP